MGITMKIALLGVIVECGLSDCAPSVALVPIAKPFRRIGEDAEKDGLVGFSKPGFDDEAAELDLLSCVFFAVHEASPLYPVFKSSELAFNSAELEC